MIMMADERQRDSQEVRSGFVKLVLEGRRAVPEACAQHGLHGLSVYAWVRQVKIDHGVQAQLP